jgi:hypothetical protein
MNAGFTFFFYYGATVSVGPRRPHRGFMITLSNTTLGKTTLDETQRLLPDNTQHSQQRDIHAPVGFEPAIPASERPQTHVLHRAAIGISLLQWH